ncbi:MAG TPA: thioredoxin family protein [Thermoanaerobaculia bacterium]|nr:thioredoxin family protein [Thermoanaerobaculia bacterium]
MNDATYVTDAHAAIDAAREQAAREGKRVAVVFGANWCPDCYALEKALTHRLVEPILEPSYVVVKVTVGNRNQNLDLMADYGMDVVRGIPAIAILEPDGTLIKAQTDGEFRNANSLLSVAEIATFFHKWAPK